VPYIEHTWSHNSDNAVEGGIYFPLTEPNDGVYFSLTEPNDGVYFPPAESNDGVSGDKGCGPAFVKMDGTTSYGIISTPMMS